MRIGIDLDGVVYPYVERFAECIGLSYPATARNWEFYKDWGLTTAQFLSEYASAVTDDRMFASGKPIDGAVETIRYFKEQGHTVHFVTDRFIGEGAFGQTQEWLNAKSIPHDSLTFTPDKTLAKVDVMLDDKPANVDAMREVNIPAWLFPRPYGDGVSEDQQGHPYLISGWDAFKKIVIEMSSEVYIGFTGYARSGKDTAAQYAVDRYGFERRGWADALKAVLLALDPIVEVNWPTAGDPGLEKRIWRLSDLRELYKGFSDAEFWEHLKKTQPEVRPLMQRLGTEGGRKNIADDIWIRTLFERPHGPRLVIPDCRFENEGEAVRERKGVLIEIERPGVTAANTHASENVLKSDYHILNDSFESLYAQLDTIIPEILASKGVVVSPA